MIGRYGKTYPEELQMKVIGTLELDSARIITTALNLPLTPEEFDDECKKLQRGLFHKAQLMKGNHYF